VERVLITFTLALIFYLIIPGIGAFLVRGRWREFRRRLIDASLLPRITYTLVRSARDGYLGSFRFFGRLQAIQGKDIMWVGDDRVTLRAEMSGVSVYELPSDSYIHEHSGVEYYEEPFPDEMPREMTWEQVFSLPEGTRMLLSGPLYIEDGHGVFRSVESRPLTVLLYDGSESTILKRSIWSGRQRNEYWNVFTAGSLSAGFISLLIYAFILFRLPLSRVPAVVSLSMALLPLCVLLPPGVVSYYLYRNFWRRGRLLRAERDLLSLTLRHFQADVEGEQETRLIDGESYLMIPMKSIPEARDLAPDAKVRSSSYLPDCLVEEAEVYVFGSYREDRHLDRPEDPMAECIIIPGNPEKLSGICARQARRMEIQAGLFFFIGLFMNYLLMLFLLGTLF
jgi:hypothetical protein